MALTGQIAMEHGQVFPFSCWMVGEVEPRRDFDQSTREKFVQATDRDSGLPLWQVQVVDADPEARETAVTVYIAAPVQPVPPEPTPGLPFRLVEFEGLTVRPWVRQTSPNSKGKLVWDFKATGIRAPAMAGKAAAGNGRGEG